MFKAGMRCGIQFNSDLYHMVLNDPDVMGKDTFGAERLRKIHRAVEAATEYYDPVLNSKHPECDVFREHMDRKLRKIWKDELTTFEKRYDELAECSY